MAEQVARFRRALVAGWFSFSKRQATFGDVVAKDVVCAWLTRAQVPYDIVGHANNGVPGLPLNQIDPRNYDLLLFVCGPWYTGRDFLPAFPHCFKVGVNLSVADPGDHGFDALFPRDLGTEAHPDLVFGADTPIWPLVGIVLVHPQPRFGERQRHAIVNRIIQDYLDRNRVAPVQLDTLVAMNQTCTTTRAGFEALVRRADFVISTRLHGMVFALKNGTPVVAIDPIAGGDKVTAQARALDWPLVFDGANLTCAQLEHAASLCLSGGMKDKVAAVRAAALEKVHAIATRFAELVASRQEK